MNKSKSWSYTLKLMALICFSAVLALLVLLRIFQTEQFLHWYAKYTQTLENFEIWIENYGATPLAVIIILVNYALKAVMPWFPVSCICVASAVIFKWYDALVINIAGLTILFALKFFWGRHFGGGNAEKLLMKYDSAYKLVDRSGLGSGVVLFLSRLLPSIPINAVSCLYGTTDMPLWRFLVISLVGFLYKAITYIIIGRNVFDPASASFIVPFIPHILLSGIIFLSLSGAIEGGNNKRKNKNEDKERLM
ncbi:MAG: TVP38/TMEM64 family protein [Ruminococcaceae bacterium]|nr:TVP38/TMEM64 family protein [Oscillospiraceae bacterium]